MDLLAKAIFALMFIVVRDVLFIKHSIQLWKDSFKSSEQARRNFRLTTASW